MTSKLTRERLEKIKSWRETYGAGSNVMLPAEEAEELACLALAAMDSEPDRNPVLAKVIYHFRDWNEGFPVERFKADYVISWMLANYPPAPVVPDRSIFEKWWESQNGAPLDGWDSLRTTDGYCDDGIDGQFEAWNAAMLSGGKS